MKGSKSATDYFHFIKWLTDELVVAGQPMNHDDIITYVLAGLRHEYDSFVASISAHTDNITLVEIYSLLLTSEACVSRHQLTPIVNNLMQLLHNNNTFFKDMDVAALVTGDMAIVVAIIQPTKIIINFLSFVKFVVNPDITLESVIFYLIYLIRMLHHYNQNKHW
jgi:hypothetical protein